MSSNKPFPKLLILLVAAVIVLGAFALYVVNQANLSRSKIPVLGEVPDFKFTERSGQPFGLAQMKGKLNVVDFIFTSCNGPCPIMAVNMGDLYRLYERSDKIQFVSISVDPERDTFETLQEYAKLQGVTDSRWLFLRAPIEEVVKLSEEGFMLAADTASLPMGHTTKFILVDHNGMIRSYHDGLNEASMNVLKQNIRQLAKALP